MGRCRPLAGVLTVLWLAACSSGGSPPAATGRSEAAASAGAALATTAPAPSRPAFGDVRFVFPVPAMTMLPMQVASGLGFDPEEGL